MVNPLFNYSDIAVHQPHKLVFFGLFLPITKWTDFQVFEPRNFKAKLRENMEKIINRIQINKSDFLIRLPKLLIYILETKG